MDDWEGFSVLSQSEERRRHGGPKRAVKRGFKTSRAGRREGMAGVRRTSRRIIEGRIEARRKLEGMMEGP